MAKLTDIQIKAWIKNDERFEGRSDGNGLVLCYRKEMAYPMWRFRYRIGGKQRGMFIGSYKDLSLAEARRDAKVLDARVTMGYDVAAEKQTRKSESVAKIEAVNNKITVTVLSDRYYQERIITKLIRPEQVLGHINRLNTYLGKLLVEDVTGKHINSMYQTDIKRGYPASTNKLRDHTLRMFGYAVAQHLIPYNSMFKFLNKHLKTVS